MCPQRSVVLEGDSVDECWYCIGKGMGTVLRLGILWSWMILGGVAAVLWLLAWLLLRRKRRWLHWVGSGLAVLGALSFLASGYMFWYIHRPWPSEVRQQPLFEGVTYTRKVVRQPKAFVLHVVRVDLQAKGIQFLVTPPNGEKPRDVDALATSAFLRKYKVQLAINASFFYPWVPKRPFRREYPRAGEPVSVFGPQLSSGKPYGRARRGYASLSLGFKGKAFIGRLRSNAQHAVSGYPVFLRKGQLTRTTRKNRGARARHPRTAVALDASGRFLFLVLVDGRQPGYSEGVTLSQLGQILRDQYNVDTALNLDGGGSTTLVQEGPNGEARVLNCPIHGRIPPGRERPVANHLGIFARKLVPFKK